MPDYKLPNASGLSADERKQAIEQHIRHLAKGAQEAQLQRQYRAVGIAIKPHVDAATRIKRIKHWQDIFDCPSEDVSAAEYDRLSKVAKEMSDYHNQQCQKSQEEN